MIPETCPKVRAKFEEWYNKDFFVKEHDKMLQIGNEDYIPPLIDFYNFPPDFHQGVYLRFFREMGVSIDIITVYHSFEADSFTWFIKPKRFDVILSKKDKDFNFNFIEAISKASEIMEATL